MVPSLTEVLSRFKTDWIQQLQPAAIEQACRDVGYVWRNRLLNPVTTVHLFFLQILYGNTACTHLPHLSGLRFTGAAYCQARSKLPLKVFQNLLEQFCSCLKNHTSVVLINTSYRVVMKTKKTTKNFKENLYK